MYFVQAPGSYPEDVTATTLTTTTNKHYRGSNQATPIERVSQNTGDGVTLLLHTVPSLAQLRGLLRKAGFFAGMVALSSSLLPLSGCQSVPSGTAKAEFEVSVPSAK